MEEEEEVHHEHGTAALRAAGFHAVHNQRNRGQRELDVVEMYSFVQSMGIDPVKESEIIWIAEEALHIPLPPGWTEYTDDRGRPYFHNQNTGESSWLHPLDELFHDLVEYYRQVQEVGGFWLVEESLSDLEEQIRRDLAEWQELFDEKGTRFYYNQQTEESRFDDPRTTVYHSLYARIKMVGKMREHLPSLANVPKPEDPSIERERQRIRAEEEQKEKVTIRMQAAFRVMIARRYARQLKQRRAMNIVPPPHRDNLRLCLKTVGRAADIQEDLVLSVTTPQRRYKAVLKVQSFVRGTLARIHYRPMVVHHKKRERRAVQIQRWIRKCYEGRRAEEKERARITEAVLTIQRVIQSRKARLYFGRLLEQHRHFLRYRLECIISIQSCFRGLLARWTATKLRAHYSATMLIVQCCARTFLARAKLQHAKTLAEPARMIFRPTRDQRLAHLLPWSWQLCMVPIYRDRVLPPPRASIDLFAGYGAASWKKIAATHIQRWVRGTIGRREFGEVVRAAREEGKRKQKEASMRPWAAATIQRYVRGWSIRRRDRTHLYRRWAARAAPRVELVQIFALKCRDQAVLMRSLAEEGLMIAAIVVQKYVRRLLARRRYERLSEEVLWPLKTWFDYTTTGRDAAQVTVQFFPNSEFNPYKYMDTFGTGHDLSDMLQSMDEEVTLCVDKYLAAARPVESSDEEEDDETCDPSQELFGLGSSSSTGAFGEFSLDDLGALSGGIPFMPVREEDEEAPSQPPSEHPDGADESSATGSSGGRDDGHNGGDCSADADGAAGIAEAPASPSKPAEGRRIHYGGCFTNGRFIKNKVTSVEQLSAHDKQAIMADLEEQRRQKMEELTLRQKKHAAQLHKQQRLEARRYQTTTGKGFHAARPSRLPELGKTVGCLPSRPLMNLPETRRLDVAERRRHLQHVHDQVVEFPTKKMPPLVAALRKPQIVENHIHHHMHQHHEDVLWNAKPSTMLPSLSLRSTQSLRSLSAADLQGPVDASPSRSLSMGSFAAAGPAWTHTGGWRS